MVNRLSLALWRTTISRVGGVVAKCSLPEQQEAEIVARGGYADPDSSFMAPSCGLYSPITIYVATNVAYSTVYTTDFTTVVAATTVTTTVTASTLTVYVSVIGATTATPPPSVVTQVVVGTPSAVTRTQILSLVQSVLPLGERTPRCTISVI